MATDLIRLDEPALNLRPEVILADEQPPSSFYLGERVEEQRRQTDFGRSRATNTLRTYRTQLKKWYDWSAEQGATSEPPSDPFQVRAWLDWYATQENPRTGDLYSPETIRIAHAAINALHEWAGYISPTKYPVVKSAMKAITTDLSRQWTKHQAKGLRNCHIAAIRATTQSAVACSRTKAATPADVRAAHRNQVDLALILVMRDGLLRRSEAAALLWSDFEKSSDGSGRIWIRRAKGDQMGNGTVCYLEAMTVEAIEAIRQGTTRGTSRIFDMAGSTINRRIQRACERSGLGNGFSGHSCRVGMAQDLTVAGYSTHDIAIAGRWATTDGVVNYTKAQAVGHGAVARYHESLRS